jgi:arsenate reductase
LALKFQFFLGFLGFPRDEFAVRAARISAILSRFRNNSGVARAACHPPRDGTVSPPMAEFTIFHNPSCGTSRNVLEAIRTAGIEPRIVEYVRQGWTREQLEALFERMGVAPRDVLRVRGTPAEELGLLDPQVSDDRIIDAMVDHPILVERPIVDAPKGARLCRPAERVADLLQS